MGKKAYIYTALILVILLSIRVALYFPQAQKIKNGQELVITTRLIDEPQIKGNRQQLKIRTKDGERITVTTGLYPRYLYGDKLIIKGKVKSSLYKGHEFFTMSYPSLQRANNDQNFIAHAATDIRRGADTLFEKSLPPASAGLLSGIVFGGNQGLPSEFMDSLRNVGVVHVIAASGMNVTFVASALISILGQFLRRKIALTIAIFGIIFYAFLSGFEPSIVRAAIMSIIAFSAGLLGRANFALVSVFITAGAMLFYAPVLLLDVGFQLSFLATLGILLIKPLFDVMFDKLSWVGKFIGDDLGTTIAAQITTLPILLSVFGSYGMLSVLVNALVLWTVPVLMVIGSIGIITGFMFEPVGKLFLFATIPILYYFEEIVMYFGNKGFILTMPPLPVAVWIGYYFIILGIIVFSSQKRAGKTGKDKKIPA